MKYVLRDCDLHLIKEAIILGDRLKALPETTSEVRNNIRQFQEVLLRLPEYAPNVDAEYGFGQYCYDKDFEGDIRGWHVCTEKWGSVWTIQIYSICCLSPFDSSVDLWRQMEEEDQFEFYPEKEPEYDATTYQRWISQVQDPESWRVEGLDFDVEADFSRIASD